ncbi:MAG: hypothetical protein GTN80_05315, partial [Nitrososphaeria archaeon]|nr:hypothetical protein [Nitrososphaeria archaeon]NIQ33045.1 hypothetical protein [Nitrososphaeria archaeon]
MLILTLFTGTGVIGAKRVLIPYHPILIFGNSGFTSENGVIGGSGTPLDPYIIDGWDIDASGAIRVEPFAGIFIVDTNVHFIIRNVWVHRESKVIAVPRKHPDAQRAFRDILIRDSLEPWVRRGIRGLGIILNNVTNGVIENTRLTGNDYGIGLFRSSYSSVVNNTVSGSWCGGILLASSFNNSVVGNNVTSSHCNGMYLKNGFDHGGIVLSSSFSNNVTDNEVTSNLCHGIYLRGGFENKVVTNKVSKNWLLGIFLKGSSLNTLAGNTVSHNYNGISLSSSLKNTLKGNTISDNIEGIYLSKSLYNTLRSNRVSSNGVGIRLSDHSHLNIIFDNYLDNAANAEADGTNKWDIPKTPGPNIVGEAYLGGNYWNDYTGVDVDRDGFGDSSRSIPGGSNVDRLPLTLPEELHPFRLIGVKVGDWAKYSLSYTLQKEPEA